MKKQICILTKSLKEHDYCVAGIDMFTGKWIRLVNSKDGDAFPKDLLDDKNYNELDIIEVELKKSVPYHTQTENWLIDDGEPIKKIGQRTIWQLIEQHRLESPQFIFGTARGELEKSETKNIDHSLELLRVENLELDTSLKGDGRHHYKVNFTYKGNKYKLALTDPKFRKEEFDGIKIPSAIIVVSIPAVPYGENELFYKFAAKIFI